MNMATAVRHCRAIDPDPEQRVERLIALYHWFEHHHRGMHSPEYAAMCAIGQIYMPGCGSGIEPDSMAEIFYVELCSLAGCEHGQRKVFSPMLREIVPGDCDECGDDSDWHCDGRGVVYCGCQH